MIGQRTSALESGPRRWLKRFWGAADIDRRQKWSFCWPILRGLPGRGLRLLDAGCGYGDWSLELGARRTDWNVVGIDRSDEAVSSAESARDRLSLDNVQFLSADFLLYEPPQPFDVVLSVASAHYLVQTGQGMKLFSQFRKWLAVGGVLVLFGPRRRERVPLLADLPSPDLPSVFSRHGLEELCLENGFVIQSLEPCIGRLGTIAKQLAYAASTSVIGRLAVYPVALFLSAFDRNVDPSRMDRSYAWRLVARRS